ncbi:hypothetical protein FDG2_4134 [Candidatus Protofrankia californiensis]|uniref:Uncharacterized protein n=1 Tax=Candidatus Protofrankia californiensis TaxID=1839754 RepID=A0A1C3P3H5_9ACTN|nr:hypothetical protein FDG2_4134 [Candidatus Protofrankia californiensis]
MPSPFSARPDFEDRLRAWLDRSGSYWSSNVGLLVIYESRAELAGILLVDFDAAVSPSRHSRSSSSARTVTGPAGTYRTF